MAWFYKLIDYEKAYDKVNCKFLQQALGMKGFWHKWCEWIESIVSGGSVGVKINEDFEGISFKQKKGLRQRDPLSPILFNIVGDMLSILISRSREKNHFQGLVPHLADGGLLILQYADDTILFLENDLG